MVCPSLRSARGTPRSSRGTGAYTASPAPPSSPRSRATGSCAGSRHASPATAGGRTPAPARPSTAGRSSGRASRRATAVPSPPASSASNWRPDTHTEHLQNVRAVWVAAGWLVAIAAASLILLVLAGLGLTGTDPATDALWAVVALVIGFWLGGFFTGF